MAAPTSRNTKPIVLSILAGLLLVVLLVLLFLPTLISTDWATAKIKQTVNSKVDGQLDFDKLSVSWADGIRCRGITYKNTAQGLLVQVAEVTTEKGLLPLATHYREFGKVEIVEPKVYVTVGGKEHGDNTGSRKATEQQEGDEPGKQSPSEKAGSPITLPEIDGQLHLRDGAVIAVLPDAKEKPVIQNLELQLRVSSPEKLLDYLVDFQSGDGTGQVKGAGNITLPAGEPIALEKMQSQATLNIGNWEINDLLTLLAATSNSPTGKGKINGSLHASGNDGSTIDIQANLVGEDITLRGGPLKTDTPSLPRIEVALEARKTASAFVVNNLSLQSPLATGSTSGTFSGGNQSEMTGEAVIDLSQLFAQFPATLNLKKGIKIVSGQVDVTTKLSASDTSTLFSAAAKVDEVRGLAGDRKISWDKPIKLEAHGQKDPEGLRLENFSVSSSFANGSGQGDINQMQIVLSADIGAALKEIEKFLDLADWKSAGKMNLDLQVSTKSADLRAVTSNIAIEDFLLNKGGKVIAPQGELKTKMTTDLRLDTGMQPHELLDTTVTTESWLGSSAATVEHIVLPSEQDRLQIKNLNVAGEIVLDRLSPLLQTLEGLPTDIQLTGKANLKTRLSANDDKLEIENVAMDVSDFFLKKNNKKLSGKDFQLSTRGSADLTKKTALLKPLEITSAAGRINLPELVVNDWSRPANGIKSYGSIDLNLGTLLTMLHDFLALPAETAIAGKAAVDVKVDLTRPGQQAIGLDSAISDLTIRSHDNPPLEEDAAHLAMTLSGNIGDQNFTFDKLDISTAPLTFTATGKVEPQNKERILTSKGSLTLDMQVVSKYLKTLADLDLEMKGKETRPFVLSANSSNGKWVDMLQHTDLETSFYADSIRGFGMLVETLSMPVKLAKGHGEVDIEATVNKGKLRVKPAVNFTVSPAEVTLPENSALLSGVGLTEDMSNDLLGHIHPIFMGTAVSQGTVDLTMERFRWPLDAAARKDAAFAGSLAFKNVKLQAGGLLVPLLAIMNVAEQEITLSDQPMHFIGENERVRCSPLEIGIEGYSLKLSGTVGFDKSLNYVAQIPVTSKMVDDDVYKYLEGTFITVPIGGTVSKPVISKNVVQKALQDLAVQAGQKELTNQAGKLLQKLFQ
ncbi:MAG: hypothetical protein ACWGOX_02500 [Desulforhopalus sp.]